MPGFTKGPNLVTPWGGQNFLRSTRGLKFEHYTLAASTLPSVTVDGTTQKFVHKGTVLAKITSGDDTGKVGPRDAGASDGRQTTANIVGICNTELPWQGLYRDVEVAVVTDAKVVQEWCCEVATGAYTAMTNTTRDAVAPGGAAKLLITLGTKSSEIAN